VKAGGNCVAEVYTKSHNVYMYCLKHSTICDKKKQPTIKYVSWICNVNDMGKALLYLHKVVFTAGSQCNIHYHKVLESTNISCPHISQGTILFFPSYSIVATAQYGLQINTSKTNFFTSILRLGHDLYRK
jgi:hypothetical protein